MSLPSKHNGNLLLTVFAACALSVLPAWTADKSVAASSKSAAKTPAAKSNGLAKSGAKGAKGAKNLTEYVLQQRDVEVGRTTVYLTRDAIRIVNLDHGFEVMTSSPDWKVTFLRRAEKKQHVTTLKEFRYFSIFGQLDTDWNRYDHLPIRGHEVRDGFPLAKYLTPGGIEIYMIENIDLAPEVGQFLQCYYHTPLVGVPFRSVYHFPRETRAKDVNWLKSSSGDFSGQKHWLSTMSGQKTSYQPSDFDYPVGFKTIKDQTLMILSNTKLDSFDSMVKEITDEDKSKRLQQLRNTAKP